MALLNEAARARIEAAIAEVERHTAGEIVVVEVPASDRYDDVRLLYGMACAVSAAALAHLLWPNLAVPWLLWLQVPVVALGAWLLGLPPLLRALLPRGRAVSAAERRAREAFLEHSVFATRDRSGILILLSELERQVVILGDSGIHARVQTAGWEQHVQHMVASIRAARPDQGVCDVIARLGTVLAANMPARDDDRDELSDRVRQDER